MATPVRRWTGNTLTLTSCEGVVLESGIGSTFLAGSGPVNETVCLRDGLSGLVVEAGGGEFPEDVSWSVTFPSGSVITGEAGNYSGSCTSPFPSPQPSVSSIPTRGCELYTVELFDTYGDG